MFINLFKRLKYGIRDCGSYDYLKSSGDGGSIEDVLKYFKRHPAGMVRLSDRIASEKILNKLEKQGILNVFYEGFGTCAGPSPIAQYRLSRIQEIEFAKEKQVAWDKNCRDAASRGLTNHSLWTHHPIYGDGGSEPLQANKEYNKEVDIYGVDESDFSKWG